MKIKVRSWLAVEVAVLLGVAMTADAVAQQAGAVVQRPAVAATATAAKGAEGPGRHEGITVHGHWVLNVRDAQGRVVEHRDFENSLQPTGSTALVSLLIGSLTPGHLSVFAQHTDSTGSTDGAYDVLPASATAEYQTYCNSHSGFCSFNLTATPVVSTATQAGFAPYSYYSGLTLEGTFKAVARISVDYVGTFVDGCQSAGTDSSAPRSTVTPQSPSTCQASLPTNNRVPLDHTQFLSLLTGTSITPLVIVAGQTLDITVVLSFS